MTSIEFKDLTSEQGQIEINSILNKNETIPIKLKWNKNFKISNDQLAALLSTFCGKAYSEIHLDFPVSNETLNKFSDFTRAQVSSQGTEPFNPPLLRHNTLLSFSGGFDSLAARALMPENTKLSSIDLGGRFSREKNFFSKFSPIIVETNIADTPFRKNSWTFMALSAIIANSFYGCNYHTFGSVLEASADNFSTNPASAKNITPPPLSMVGLQNAPYVQGLSEVGTLLVILQSDPAIVADGLVSLASPGEEKLHRKKMLTIAAAQKLGIDIDLPDIVSPPRPHFHFGQVFSVDLLALYIGVTLGKEAAQTMVRDLPDSALKQASHLGMDFMEKWNPTLYQNFPKLLLPELMKKLAIFDIPAYTEQDWEQISNIRDILKIHL